MPENAILFYSYLREYQVVFNNTYRLSLLTFQGVCAKIIPVIQYIPKRNKKGWLAVSFYTAVIILVWVSLAILIMMVHGNDEISHKNRQVLYVTYCLVAASALAEWLGVKFAGDPSVPIWLLRIIKALDFILTPLAGRLLIRQLQIKNGILKIMTGILILNTAFQFASLFTDWMITVDPKTHEYSEGNLYWLFVAESIVILMLIVAQFMVYGRSYRKRNRFSLYAVLVMVMCGIVFQEIIGNNIRTDYIAVMFGLLFLYIHFNGYSQQSLDDQIRRQEKTINTDTLTGLKSRYAYIETLKEYNSSKPDGLVAFSIT